MLSLHIRSQPGILIAGYKLHSGNKCDAIYLTRHMTGNLRAQFTEYWLYPRILLRCPYSQGMSIIIFQDPSKPKRNIIRHYRRRNSGNALSLIYLVALDWWQVAISCSAVGLIFQMTKMKITVISNPYRLYS